ncbi:hypothetical protein, variant [Capsaspora owczarzaki ATCC 30864]|uniref:Guanine nucleotide-binding protein subunit beta-like protein n=1 Tax=Capsaspora owczarzaki (strain ATCC 30864) TaxID=595528 RepID=A0A0D2WLA9_CAPO3|nr:hypothetical protein, variant [Capsaspora owczarzaki ATCC 30864]KJE90578.1 hypothetical protein, variant [Capsaspora owczarzaki ATCC 30864]|eukprot:XP_011270063.1 hypothetical protein, variant [Capsaspora owczarzaki ATCC 30864]
MSSSFRQLVHTTERIFTGHKKTVTCIDILDDVLFTGSADGKARAFDIRTGALKHTFAANGHSSAITCLALVRHPGFVLNPLAGGTTTPAAAGSTSTSSSQPATTSSTTTFTSSSSPTITTATTTTTATPSAAASSSAAPTTSSSKAPAHSSSAPASGLPDFAPTDTTTTTATAAAIAAAASPETAPPLFLFTAGNDKTVRVWNATTGQCLRVFRKAHSGYIYCLCVDVDRGRMYTGAGDHLIVEWNLLDESKWRVFKGHTDWVRDVKVPMGTRTLFSASNDGTIRRWNLETAVPDATIWCEASRAFCLCFGDDRLFAGMSDKLGRCLDPRTGGLFQQYVGHKGPLLCLDVSGGIVVTGSGDKSVRCWDAVTGVCYSAYVGHSDWVRCVKIYGNLIFSASDDCTVRCWALSSTDMDSAFGGSTLHDQDTLSLRSRFSHTEPAGFQRRIGASFHSSPGHFNDGATSIHRMHNYDGVSLHSAASLTSGLAPVSSGPVIDAITHNNAMEAMRKRQLELEATVAQQTSLIASLERRLETAIAEKHTLERTLECASASHSERLFAAVDACASAPRQSDAAASGDAFRHLADIRQSVHHLEQALTARHHATATPTSEPRDSAPGSCAASLHETST